MNSERPSQYELKYQLYFNQDTVFLSMLHPGLPDCTVCRFPLLTGIVSLWDSSQKVTVASITLHAQSEQGEGDFQPVAWWAPRARETLWRSNFTERKMWGNCVNQCFFLDFMKLRTSCLHQNRMMIGWMTSYFQCCLSTLEQRSIVQHSILSEGPPVLLFIGWGGGRKERKY